MRGYKILCHRADLKIKVIGRNLKELFETSALALGKLLRPSFEKKAKKILKRNIKIKSFSLETLLVDFLSEILFLSLTNKEIYFQIKIKKFKDFRIEAQIFAKKIKRFGLEIKGVSYHNLKITRKNNFYEATLIFDI